MSWLLWSTHVCRRAARSRVVGNGRKQVPRVCGILGILGILEKFETDGTTGGRLGENRVKG